MKKLIGIIIMLLQVSLAMSQTSQAFYIGHSLSDQIPDMVKSLAQNHSEASFDWVYQSIPGAPLRWQWQRMAADDYTPNPPHYYGFYHPTGGLPSGSFNTLVLTESVPRFMIPWSINETYEYAEMFAEYAAGFSPDIKIYIYEVWHCLLSGTPTGCDYDQDANPWRQRLDDDLPMWESVVDYLNEELNLGQEVCLIPGGQGLARLHDEILAGTVPGISDISELFSDNIHLTDQGKYFIACIHFAMITGQNPIGLTNQLQVWWGGNFEAPTPDQALRMQEIAWETVISYPNSCVNQVLSVVDLNFSAAMGNNHIVLHAELECSSNCHYLHWQHSQDGISFKALKRAELNEEGSQKLTLVHEHPTPGFNYYRLKIVNRDGEISYSPIKLVNVNNVTIDIFPNPVQDYLNVIPTNIGVESCTIVSLDGRAREFDISNPIYVGDWPSGIYFCRVGEHWYKFIKQ